MGHAYQAKCKKCGHEFNVEEGGGFSFHLLRCDKCGKTKSINFDELGEYHSKYIKGLIVPYSVATSKQDKYIQENYPGESISEEDIIQKLKKLLESVNVVDSLHLKHHPDALNAKQWT